MVGLCPTTPALPTTTSLTSPTTLLTHLELLATSPWSAEWRLILMTLYWHFVVERGGSLMQGLVALR